ncbi:MAG: efflux RND transporter periplasmic adaptor subunit [Marinobacter sp.]|uniref:efflux RND transporter periplasmic adaptor subunit n=1 Tax=Marinobacter sp. TaxID=50741 RepID=UPI00299F1DF3|nr:efflux RND transporter periplasmic adaptor subunit [Marinobacter sp.]MDX1635916.1 efflux RND transporter periplasmic adaptor subunit [Marinobacter sp.]
MSAHRLLSKRILVPLVLVLVTVLLVWLFSALKPTPPEKTAEERTWPVRVTTLEAAARAPQLRLLGRVETPYSSTLTAAVTANVAAIPVLEGQAVQAGEIIVELARDEVELLVAQRQADVDELQAQLATEQNQYRADQQIVEREQELVALARRALEREQRLAESNLTSQTRIDQARQALQAAELSLINRRLAVANHDSRMASLQARLERARALLAQARLDLASTRVRAPFDGVVTSIEASPGERVRAGEALASLYATAELEVRAQIPMKRVENIRQALARGETLVATSSLGEQRFELVLDRLSGKVDPGAGGVDGLFHFRQEQPPVTLNRSIDLRLNLAARPDTFTVPVASLYDENTVYRIRDGRLEPVPVTILGDRFEDGSQQLLVQSEVLQGGDQVLVTQLPNALRGLKVEVIEAEPLP